jgi:prolyl 4-hydroxylase
MEFIYRKENALSLDLCNNIIEKFNNSKNTFPGILGNGINSEAKKSIDLSFASDSLNDPEMMKVWGDVLGETITISNECVKEYCDKFSYLKLIDPFQIEAFNIQKYNPGDGFYKWHCESNLRIRRIVVWMIYLNTVENGGTEFMHQNHIEKAEAGKLLIWPPDWTHAHKGQISETETKYILTGWYSIK